MPPDSSLPAAELRRRAEERLQSEPPPAGGPATAESRLVREDVAASRSVVAEQRAGATNLARLIDSVDGIVWEADAATFQFTYVNAHAERLLGYPVARWIEESSFWADHIHPDDRDQAVRYCVTCTEKKQDHDFEYRMLAADGRTVWFRDIVTVEVEDGRPIKLTGMMVDITPRKAAEEKLRQSEERTRRLLQAGAVGLWEWDLLTETVYFSPEWKRQLGYADDEIANRFDEWQQRVHPEDLARALAAVADFREGRVPHYSIEIRLLHRDGSWRWISAEADVERNEKGEPVMMMGSHIDITERKRIDLALQESNARWQFALEGAGAGVWDWDVSAGTVFFSKRWKEMFGYREDEIGTGIEEWSSRVHPEDLPRVMADLQPHLDGVTASYTNEHRVRCKDGSYKWILDRGLVITRDPAGKPLRVVGTHADISERVQAQEALRRSTQLLDASQSIAQTGGWEMDLATQQLFWTAETYRLHDTTPEEYHPTVDAGIGFYLPESRPILSAALQAAMERGEGYDLVLELRTTKGRRIDVRTTCAVTLHEGRPAKLTGIFQDITERKTAEAARLKAFQTQAAILDALPAHIALLDPQGNIIAVNENWRRFASGNAILSPDFLVGQNYVAACESATGDCSSESRQVAAGLRDLLEGRQFSFEIEYPCHSPEEQRWFRLMATPLTSGGRDGVVVMHVNVTARKLAESQIRLLETSVAKLNDAVIITEVEPLTAPGPRIIFVNEATERMTGYTRAELIGQTPRMFQGPRTDRAALARIAAALRLREPVQAELVNYTKAGTEYWIELNLAPVASDTGVVTHFVAIERDITARRAAEAALQDSVEQYRALFDTSPVPLALNDAAQNIVRVNAAFEEMFGYAQADIPTLADWWPKAYPDPTYRRWVAGTWQERLARAAQDGTRFEALELTIRCRDGTNRVVMGSASALGATTEGLHLVALYDITDRKRAEIALQESNRALKIVSGCNEALVRSENEADLLATICRIAVEVGGFPLVWVGYAQDDERKTVLPQAHAGNENGYLAQLRVTWSDTDPSGAGPSGRVIRSGEMLIVPDLAADETCAPWLAAAHAQGYLGLICLPLKNQTRTFGVLLLYLPEVRIPGADELQLLQKLAGDLAFGLGMLRVRAERIQAAQEIAHQAALLDQATDAILVKNLDHRITYWSKGAERLYGWNAEEALGESVLELLHKASNAADYQLAMDQTLVAGEWQGEFTKLTKADGELTIEARWTLLRDDEGAPQAILAINTDITERKKLEQQFLRAQRMESIGTLAGGIAHDLNNVLGPIMMSLDLLRMRFPDRASLELINIIDASAQHGAGMVRQVLSFGRGVEGQRLEVQVKHLIKEIEKITNETFLKNVQVSTVVPHDLWPVIGDPTQIHQVLLNLCVNARDAMPGGGKLVISAENLDIDELYASANIEATPGPYIVLQVEDSGTGMPPEVIEKIFDPFFTTKELGKGTGLGLSTTLAIVKSHGGFIRVYSEWGRGTKFHVYLPAQTGASPEARVVAEADRPRGFGELILVIDDEASVRQITEQTLTAFGYRVVVTSEGAAAIAAFAPRMSEFAAVLTDMMMPVMDGLATIRVLRRMAPRLPIIASSGLDTERKAAEVAALGVKHFLVKPYTAETLLKTLKQALAEGKPGR